MMMDTTELKKAAEAATSGPWECSDKHDGRFWHIHSGNQAIGSTHAAGKQSGYANLFEANAKFIAAANPAAVLELIADKERNQRMLLAACMDMGAIGNALNADMNSDGDELLGMVVDLKAEVDSLTREADRQYTTIEAYRKDAERYRWLLKNASVILDTKTAYQAETGFIKFDTMPARTEIESAIDAAMGKEAKL